MNPATRREHCPMDVGPLVLIQRNQAPDLIS
jgi:hypothetical protein